MPTTTPRPAQTTARRSFVKLARVAFAVLLVNLHAGCATKDRLDVPRLMTTFDSLRAAVSIPGLAVAILHDTTVLEMTGLGYADIPRETPVGPDTPFRIASITKPITATLALRLRDQGRLALDTTMRSFESFVDLCEDAKQAGGIFFDDWACDDPSLTRRHLLSMTANGPPGTRFFYNPVSYSWASRPISTVVGEPFSALVQTEIFAPTGMTRSARLHRDLPLRPDLARELATPHGVDENGTMRPAPLPQPQGDGAAGGIVSTIRDLAAFDVALQSGQLLDPSVREELWMPFGPGIAYGLGWFVADVDGERAVWHTGLWEGAYSGLYLKLLDRGYTLILLANSDGLQWETRFDEAALERSPFAMAFVRATSFR